MDPDVSRIAMVFTIIGAFATVMTIVGVTASRILARKPKSTDTSDTAPVVSEARFARLEQAIDVIAVEVERIAEAQRFSAQLISEKLPDRLPAAGGQRREENRPGPVPSHRPENAGASETMPTPPPTEPPKRSATVPMMIIGFVAGVVTVIVIAFYFL